MFARRSFRCPSDPAFPRSVAPRTKAGRGGKGDTDIRVTLVICSSIFVHYRGTKCIVIVMEKVDDVKPLKPVPLVPERVRDPT